MVIEKWTIPSWMESYKDLIPCHESQIEELVNCGSEVNVFNNAPKALMATSVKSAVTVLENLKKRGKLL